MGKPYATLERPSAGMFMWIDVAHQLHSRFVDEDSIAMLNDELFERIFEAGVVVMPAKTFAVGVGSGKIELMTKACPCVHGTSERTYRLLTEIEFLAGNFCWDGGPDNQWSHDCLQSH